MSGELQTIPARHGVATFVPRGRTVKIINTYGKQVVSMWAFSLGAPPLDDDEEEAEKEGQERIDQEQVQKEAEDLKKTVEVGEGNLAEKHGTPAQIGDGTGEKETERTEKQDKTLPEQDLNAPEGDKAKESITGTSQQPQKRTWASYLPSIPYRNRNTAAKADEKQPVSAEEEKAQNEANTRKWSSYLPTGKSFSSYVPNMQLPDSKEAISSFKASHYRDPNKSYAEQLYDFSKTPVGAGTIAAATGSGYASSVYAAYSAYASTHPSSSSRPPMEYLSLPHTRASSHKLVPEANDTLLTNLRNPIMTLVEDTSPGAHDTLTAACDAHQYAALRVDKPEEHGSCAENLVLALKEMNENAGLKGAKAVGADITVNIAPTPLHLFMNAPLKLRNEREGDGAGAKGTSIEIEEPKGKKRSFVRFRAERDIVVVFSACPMDVGKQNGGRCMAANYMVEDIQEGEGLATSISSASGTETSNESSTKNKANSESAELKKQSINQREPGATVDPGFEGGKHDRIVGEEKPKRPAPKKLRSDKSVSGATNSKQDEETSHSQPGKDESKSVQNESKKDVTSCEQPTKEKKKPKKLQVRSGGSAVPTKSS